VNGLEGMVRLAKWRVDEARKALLEVDQRLHQIDADLEAFERSLESEQAIVGDPLAAATYGAYAGAVIARRQALMAERRQVESEREARQDALAEAFQEQKKYEIVAARRAEEAEEAAKKHEQAALDEMGLQRHARAQAPS